MEGNLFPWSPSTENLLPAGMACPIVAQGSFALGHRLSSQLFGASHVTAELASVFLLDKMHFVNGSLQIVSCGHRLVMKFVGTRGAGNQ